jgi:NAD(P)-dependent dehydrogenase (short-subunit alcohol dehydrogenase family)
MGLLKYMEYVEYMEIWRERDMMTAFLTGIANEFDVELARVFAENGYKVYAGDADDAGKGSDAEAFAELIRFDPDNPDSIDKACGQFLQNPGYIDIYINTADYKLPEDNFILSNNSDNSNNIDYAVFEKI